MRIRIAGVLGLLALGGCTSTRVLQRDGCWVRETKRSFGRVSEEVGPCARPAPAWSGDRLTRLVQECVAHDDYRWQARALAAWGRGEPAPERAPDQQVLEACMTQATRVLNSEKEAVARELAEAQAQLAQVSQQRDALEGRLTSERAALEAKLERERQAQLAQLVQEREYLRTTADKDRTQAAKEREALRASAERDREHLHESGKLLAKELGENGKLMAKALGEGAKRPTPNATATATATSTGTGRALTENDSKSNLRSDTKAQTPSGRPQAPGNTAVVPVYPPVMYAPGQAAAAPVSTPRVKRAATATAPACIPAPAKVKGAETICTPQPAKAGTPAPSSELTTLATPAVAPEAAQKAAPQEP